MSSRNERLLPVLISGLVLLAPFSINIYLPSFPEMRHALSVTEVEMQLTLTLYFASFAFMTLWHGSLSDSFGRRQVVLVGLTAFTFSSIGCVLATEIQQIYAFRILQGFSAGAGIVVGRAIVRDLYDGHVAQRIFATVIMLSAVAPAVAPVLGGWLQVSFGWRSVFAFLALMGTVLLVLVWFYLPETLAAKDRHPLSVTRLAQGYHEVLTNLSFVSWAVTFAIMYGGFFIYVLSAPVFVMQHMGLGETDFLWLFGPSTLGMMTGSFIATKVAHLWSVTRILVSAFGFMLAAMIWNLSVGLYQPEDFGWYLPYMFIYTVGLALAMPTVNLMGLDCVPSRRGMGASLQLFVQTAFNALIAALLAPFFWETPLKLAAGAAMMTLLALLGVIVSSNTSNQGKP